MSGPCAVAALEERSDLRRDWLRLPTFGEGKFVAVNAAKRMKPGSDFRSRFRIGIDRRRHTLGGPALEKSFTTRDTGLRIELHASNRRFGSAPTLRAVLAQSVILPANPLQVEKEVALSRAETFLPGWKRCIRDGGD